MKTLYRQIHTAIATSNQVVIVAHAHPDGDALGSMAAMKDYVSGLGKNVSAYSSTPIDERWHFIHHSQSVKFDPTHLTQADLIIVVDSGDLRYAGVDKHLANSRATIINIDHHITNNNFGHINLVVPTASSTSEIVHQLLRHHNIIVTPNTATALLTGIITDTDNFTNSATSHGALRASSELLRAGANLKQIIQWTVKNKTVPALKLWGAALERLACDVALDLTYTYITRADLAKHGASDSEAEGIANYLTNLGGSKITMILKETLDGQIKGSLRTTQDDVDVAAMAKQLGGGGHKKAAGFTVAGTIDEVLKKILQK